MKPLTGKPYVPSQDTYMDYGNFADDARHPILSALQVFDEIMTVSTATASGFDEVMTVRTATASGLEETERETLGGEKYYTYD